jgi:hypothetical protein
MHNNKFGDPDCLCNLALLVDVELERAHRKLLWPPSDSLNSIKSYNTLAVKELMGASRR